MSAQNAMVLRDLQIPVGPSVLTVERATNGPRLAPRKVIQTYDPDEWEIFIEEWAAGMQPRYEKVQRFGGSGDRGVDVAGFRTSRGFEGDWDCFQGKHYESSLTPSAAWPEILKIFLLPVRNPLYSLPSSYSFIAPRGLTTSLAHLISTPSELKSKFLEQMKQGGSQPFRSLSEENRSKVTLLAQQTDFSIFGSIEVVALLHQHSLTSHYAARFGGGLPSRPAAEAPPTAMLAGEMEYLRKLVDAYKERHHGVNSLDAAQSHEWTSKHLRRQREAFFRAEALRRFARDSVPPRTFEGLQDEVYDAVVETVEASHVDGLERLRQTLEQAINAQLSANALIQVTEPADRRGICHQLANDNRLNWVEQK